MKKIAIIITIIILAFIANTLISIGFFRIIENRSEWKVEKKIPVPGAEDITISPTDSFALISSTKRINYPPTDEEFGGLYLMDLRTRNYMVKNLTAYLSRSFAPHGISMIKTDDGYKVMVVNHTLNGNSIEVFRLLGDSLIFIKSLIDPSIKSPNDIVMVDEEHFYFTNDHGYTKGIGKFLEEYLGLSVSNVVYCDGKNYREVAAGIAYANGINFDPVRQLIFVASPRKFSVKVYTKTENGSLEFIEDIPCGTGVDNIDIDKDGILWVGGHPNLLRFKAYAKGQKQTSPSEIVKINYKGRNDYTVESVYMDDGNAVSASTVAAHFGDIVLVGNFKDSKFLVLKKGK